MTSVNICYFHERNAAAAGLPSRCWCGGRPSSALSCVPLARGGAARWSSVQGAGQAGVAAGHPGGGTVPPQLSLELSPPPPPASCVPGWFLRGCCQRGGDTQGSLEGARSGRRHVSVGGGARCRHRGGVRWDWAGWGGIVGGSRETRGHWPGGSGPVPSLWRPDPAVSCRHLPRRRPAPPLFLRVTGQAGGREGTTRPRPRGWNDWRADRWGGAAGRGVCGTWASTQSLPRPHGCQHQCLHLGRIARVPGESSLIKGT